MGEPIKLYPVNGDDPIEVYGQRMAAALLASGEYATEAPKAKAKKESAQDVEESVMEPEPAPKPKAATKRTGNL